MTEEHEKLLKELRNKIYKLNTLYTDSKKSLIQKDIEIEDLKESLKRQKDEFAKLEDKYNTLETAKSFSSNTDGNDIAKNKIDKMVREIDKCIALLNS